MMSMWFRRIPLAKRLTRNTSENEIKYLIVGLVAILAGVVLAFLVKPIKRLMEGVN